jgi:polyribonucleotide nucleotidyltransferase
MGKIPPRTIQKIPPRTIISGPVKTEEELVVISSPIEEKSLPGNRLLLTNIQGGDYGRIVGSGGSNIYRIETEYEIVVSTRGSVDGTYSLMISGNNEEMRKAAADDIIRGLTVVTNCSNLQLLKRIKNFRLYEVGKKYYVMINRTFASDGISGKTTLIGRLASCQSAYVELLAEIDVSQTKQKKGPK